MRFCAWLKSLYSWWQDQIVQGFIRTEKDWKCLFWKDLVQGINQWSIFINGKDLMQILTLMHSIIDSGQRQTRKRGFGGRESHQENSYFWRIIMDRFSTKRMIQGDLKPPINSWTSSEAIASITKPPQVHKYAAQLSQFASLSKFDYHDSCIINMF